VLVLMLVAVVVVLVVSAVLGLVLMVITVSVSLAITADTGLDSSATCCMEGLGDLSSFSGLGVASRVGMRGAGCWL
jgi:hypothetical protein